MPSTTIITNRRKSHAHHSRGASRLYFAVLPNHRCEELDMNYRIVAVVTVLMVAAGVAIAVANARLVPNSATSAPPVSMISVGDDAPPFAVTTTTGQPVDSSKIQGPMLLEVFATWCPHCQREVAQLDKLWQSHGRGVTFIAVSGSDLAMDHTAPASLDDVQRFQQLLGVDYPIAYDSKLDVAQKYLQGGYPTIVFIDRNKKIVAIESGEIPLKKLEADLAKATGSHA
jgi:thiol-disulfide isomerase/thioredoxin